MLQRPEPRSTYHVAQRLVRVACVATMLMLAGCTAAVDTTRDAVSSPVLDSPTVVPSDSATDDVPDEQPVEVSDDLPEPTGLSIPVLVSDGFVIHRVKPDGSAEELYRVQSSGLIYSFASDGNGGVVLQQVDDGNENDYIALLPAGAPVPATQADLLYPIDSTVRLDLIGVTQVEYPNGTAQPFLMYQRIDPCCGALQSMGTLRLTNLNRSVPDLSAGEQDAWHQDSVLSETRAWEGGTSFSTLSGPTLVGRDTGHEREALVEWAGDEIVFSSDSFRDDCGPVALEIVCGGGFDVAAAWEGGIVVANTVVTDGDAHLVVSIVDRSNGQATEVASLPTHDRSSARDIFVDGDVAVISRQLPTWRDDVSATESLPIFTVDLQTGEGRELSLVGEARPDLAFVYEQHAPEAGAESQNLDEVAYDSFDAFWGDALPSSWMGMTADDVKELLGEPEQQETFEWAGGEEGLVLSYPDFVFTIHYGVSSVRAMQPGTCTAEGVCVGDSLTAVERTYGFRSTPSTDGLSYPVEPVVGYCSVAFEFGPDGIYADVVAAIETSCVPD